MLKVRLMGTKNDIVWFQKILQRHPKVEVLEISELYSNCSAWRGCADYLFPAEWCDFAGYGIFD